MKKYVPFVVMVGIALAATCLLQRIEGVSTPEYWMRVFVAMFLITFSIPKLMRLTRFAQTFATYDLGARHVPLYGYAYPFIEMGLGLLYLTNLYPNFTNGVALFVMTLSAFGVFMALHHGRKVESASLGTVFRMPLTWIALAEYAVVAGIAATFLWWV